jgi:hypothetical protein
MADDAITIGSTRHHSLQLRASISALASHCRPAERLRSEREDRRVTGNPPTDDVHDVSSYVAVDERQAALIINRADVQGTIPGQNDIV